MLVGLSLSLLRRNPIFRNYLAASTVSLIGSGIFDIAMPLYVLERTQSVMALSWVTVCLHLPHFLMAPLTGFFADHFSKRKVMLYSDLAQIVAMLFLMVYVLSNATPIWPILVVVFFAKSMMLMFETVATFQLVPALVTLEDLPAANTWVLSLHRLVQIAGPFFGGILMKLLGAQSCIFANIVSFAATLYFTWRMTNLDQIFAEYGVAVANPKVTVGNVMKSFFESLEYVWRTPLFRSFILCMFLWNLSSLTLNSPSLTYYFTVTHKYNAAEYGTVVALFGVFGFVGFTFSTYFYRLYDFRAAFAGSCLAQAIFAAAAILFSAFPTGMAMLYALSRVAASVLSWGTFQIRQTKVPKQKAGGVNACLRMFFMSAAPISAFLQGPIISTVGVTISLILGSACLWGAYYYSREVAEAYTPEPETESGKEAA